MNILFIERNISPSLGGVERATWALSSYFTSVGFSCFYAFYDRDDTSVDDFYKMHWFLNDDQKQLNNRFISFINDKSIDVVVSQGIFSWRIVRLFKSLRESTTCKLIACHHLSPDYLDFQTQGVRLRVKSFIYSKLTGGLNLSERAQFALFDIVDKWIMLSSSFFEDFLKRGNRCNSKKLIAIPDPLSFDYFADSKCVKNKKNQVLIVSRLEDKQKNITGALKIWKQIEDSFCENWNLVLAGYGPDEEMVISLAKELGLKNFKFVGKTESPLPLYKESKVFMMTSNYEGFGMTLTEAMQCGCVPVAFDTYSSVRDIIDHNVNGIIVPAKDNMQYVESLDLLMQNEEYLTSMAFSAVEKSKEFSLDNVANSWLKLLNELN